VARLTDARLPASPSSDLQKARYQRIIEVAVELGSRHDFERVQMQDVAVEAEVAIATLYRYFPSKVHLFVAVMKSRVDRVDQAQIAPQQGQSPAVAAGDLLITITDQMYAERRLSLSLIQAMTFAESLDNRDRELVKDAFFEIVLRLAGWNKDPSEDQRRRAWLLTQCWFGVLMMVLNQSRTVAGAEADIRRACELLLLE
jgi:AcrR family transcriptional regulator